MSRPMSQLLPPMSRRTKLAIVVATAVVAVVAASLLVSQWGEHLLAALSAATLVLLAAHTARAEQQHRRTQARLGRLETKVRNVRTDLKPIAAASTRSRRQLERVDRQLGRMDAGFKDPKKFGLLREVERVSRRSFEQVQATINLFEMVDVQSAVPPMRSWAISPDALALLVQEMIEVRPSLVVECGSGTSTMWLALAAKQHGIDARIVALDHEEEYAEKTNRLLRLHGVDDIAEARLAPLAELEVGDLHQPWYDVSALKDLDGVGLLFVDGPPARTAPMARVPALPLLWDRLAPTASIVIDDSTRPDEIAMVERWLGDHPGLADQTYDTEKGTVILRRS